jgi:c-di-GMP-binding flagellar brake protein YcgR
VEEARQNEAAGRSQKTSAAEQERPDGAVRDTAGKALAPRDRRKEIRQSEDSSAAILLVRVGSTLRGRILDLSLSGCRVRTNDRFPLGIYTRVETEFRIEGISFRLGGVIQAIHDSHTVGVRFLDLSERKREQISDLMQEIAELRAAQGA